MLKLAKWCGVVVLVLPCVAKAYTVEITSTSRGTMQPDNAFLALLGMTTPTSGDTQPYSLSIASFVDSAAPGYYEDPLASVARADPTLVEVDFTFGGQRFHYTGQGGTFLSARQYGYIQQVYFFLPQSPSIEIVATHFDDMPGSPLNPASLDDAEPLQNALDAGLYARLDQDTPGATVGMEGRVASFSIHAVSPVPEPAPAGMMAGGLALLLWRAARRRRRLSPPSPWSRPGSPHPGAPPHNPPPPPSRWRAAPD